MEINRISTLIYSLLNRSRYIPHILQYVVFLCFEKPKLYLDREFSLWKRGLEEAYLSLTLIKQIGTVFLLFNPRASQRLYTRVKAEISSNLLVSSLPNMFCFFFGEVHFLAKKYNVGDLKNV